MSGRQQKDEIRSLHAGLVVTLQEKGFINEIINDGVDESVCNCAEVGEAWKSFFLHFEFSRWPVRAVTTV